MLYEVITISVGEQTGVVPKEKRRMLHGVFELAQIRVRDVMIPRTEVVGIEVNATFEEALSLARESRHSRFPVYEGSLDSVVGIIHSKDILNFVGRPEEFDLHQIARPPYFVRITSYNVCYTKLLRHHMVADLHP